HGGGDTQDQTGIKGFGNQVLGAKTQSITTVGRGYCFVLLFFGQSGNGAGSGFFHATGNRGGAHIQRTAEDVGEAQHVVDLVREVRAASCHDHVVAGGFGHFRQDFGG